MKKVFVMLLAGSLLYACSGGGNDTEKKQDASTTAVTDNPSYDPKRGEGKFTHVEVSDNLDVAKADAGNKVYEVKCAACHKLSTEKLVGPGWSGVAARHAPEWIMNFITNPDAMLDKDPAAQAQLEICLVRMPNQNLSDEDARNVYEFMRKNDGVK